MSVSWRKEDIYWIGTCNYWHEWDITVSKSYGMKICHRGKAIGIECGIGVWYQSKDVPSILLAAGFTKLAAIQAEGS